MSYTAEPKQQDTNIKVPLISKIAYGMQHLFDGLFVKPGSLHSQQAVSGTGRVAPCAIQRKCFKQRNLFLVGHSYKLSLVLDFQPEISYTKKR